MGLCGFSFFFLALKCISHVLLLHCLFSFMWYSWFSPFFFSCSLAGRSTVSGAIPLNCGSDKTDWATSVAKPFRVRAQRHWMARQSVSVAMLSGARWTHCKKDGNLTSDFILCPDLKPYEVMMFSCVALCTVTFKLKIPPNINLAEGRDFDYTSILW